MGHFERIAAIASYRFNEFTSPPSKTILWARDRGNGFAMTKEILVEFVIVADGYQFVEAPRVDEQGTVYFSDLTAGGYFRRKPGNAVETVLKDRLWIGGACT